MKIILFEDSPQYELQLLESLNAALGNKGTAYLFSTVNNRIDNQIREHQLRDDLIATGQSDACLIVADSDLSKHPVYGGLSEPTVRSVADSLAIPECAYARGESEPGEFLRSAELREARIALSLQRGEDHFARQVVSIAEGFKFIREQLRIVMQLPGKKSPGKTLGTILEKPEYSEKIALYATGDQNRIATVLKARNKAGAELHQRLACLFGYWLWDSVLEYPGIVVDEVAASSYLNIELKAFQKQDVRDLFQTALYCGPFAKARDTLWWRGVLDDIVAQSEAADGREFVNNTLGRILPQSQCCEDPTIPAGYYCMLSHKPVSLKNSKNGLTWFPRGADLARVSISKHEELGPWL